MQSHTEVCLQVCEGYQLTGNYCDLNERAQETRQVFCGLGNKKLPRRSDPSDLKVRIVSTCCFMVSPFSNMTPGLRAELQKGLSL